MKKIVNLKNNPSVIGERDTIKSGAINTVAALLTMPCYFFSYVSSNSSLDLNAKYDFKQMWNIIPTCIGTTTFNGFAFLMIFIAASALAKKYAVYNSEKRNCVDRAHKVLSFLKSDPTILSKMPTNSVGMVAV